LLAADMAAIESGGGEVRTVVSLEPQAATSRAERAYGRRFVIGEPSEVEGKREA
jgi:hypothetical protein